MKTKRLLAVLMCCLIACTMVACGGGTGDDPIDPTKTQLYISNYDGGFGDEWLRALADRFEELHKDDRLEEGENGDPGSVSQREKAGQPDFGRNAYVDGRSVFYGRLAVP